MRTFTVAICAALVGALIGAWIVHLSEGNARLSSESERLDASLNLCSAREKELRGAAAELGRRFNLCLVEKAEALEALKVKAGDSTLIPGSGKK